ncbi:CCCH-type zinc finger family protein [Pelomyxa schiedti]|nr:CCCH-type zinc finger family protein [Pelomyxa schiedti]
MKARGDYVGGSARASSGTLQTKPVTSRDNPSALDRRGWERSDFPIICETCLGDNPYVRMTKAEFDKECKVCLRPFTVFRWRPGANARHKKTEVCQTCAKLKNVCQVCLLDLEYGLPTQVRDIALQQAGVEVPDMPQSETNSQWLQDLQLRKAETGQEFSYEQVEPSSIVVKLARNTPYYARNRAHICSFFVKGQCKRGAECPYRHEMPVQSELSTQNLKDRYYGVNDPVARKLLRQAERFAKLPLPADPDIATLYVGNLDPSTTEADIRDAFYSFGEIKSLRLVPAQTCAFVTYTTREAAEAAADKLFNTLTIKGKQARIAWGKKFDPTAASTTSRTSSDPLGGISVLPPGVVLPPPPPPGDLPPPPGLTLQYPLPVPVINTTLASTSASASASTTTSAVTSTTSSTPALTPPTTFYPSMDPARLGSAPRQF